ncbi:MAG: poly-gamma-glutamate synthase PgsB [candidate division KSB1 bacterium]|nr:poly-gamma-glutamate synthase PgsB [candidate division KSB1 bacterium]MDZ7300608.1 poly-gamma-glutamate synthase PgsB [candidate division KSB1 bacterium]MDZ7309745.1 poly-gamma-glutamate synthase PgsB [candidate division KSB1 bacterium]
MKLLPLVLSVFIFLLYLIYERILLNRQRNAIPLRISVTGTRGKSSVVRIIASILREDGRRVIAKTTGSQARYVMPDAQEIEIKRCGITSIIEQKKFIKKAAKIRADCLVAEIMSIHPENHYIESHQILQPHIIVITNVRQDHTEAMGKTKEEIASVFCLDIPAGAVVFVPQRENNPLFVTAAQNAAGELIEVPEGISSSLLPLTPDLTRKEFSDNLDLVCALGRHLHIDPKVILTGIRKTQHDIGELKIWKYRSHETQKTFYFVNGFAANDPESTWQVLAKVKKILPSASDKLIGLLSLRADRGDRSKQWFEFLSNGAVDGFSRLYVTGAHANIFKRTLQSAVKPRWFAYSSDVIPEESFDNPRYDDGSKKKSSRMTSRPPSEKLQSVSILKNKPPEAMMKTLLAEIEDQSVIFGFGNMKGRGELLVDYWNKIGEVYEL